MTLLALRGAALIRGGRLLFDRLDLVLDPGEAVHITGPNGCGKSSLLRLAAGLLRPDAGTIARSRVALADDHLAIDRERSLSSALALWGGDVALGLAMMGLDGLAGVPVRLLSTGQARRARLARVIASGAPLWLLDEPGNGLDTEGLGALDAAIAGHRAAGGAVLAASHTALGGPWRPLALGQ